MQAFFIDNVGFHNSRNPHSIHRDVKHRSIALTRGQHFVLIPLLSKCSFAHILFTKLSTILFTIEEAPYKILFAITVIYSAEQTVSGCIPHPK